MKKIKLEARLDDKTLSIGNKTIKLDDSLFYAGVSLLDKDERVLELKYRKEDIKDKEKFIQDESEKIYLSLEEQSLSEKINVDYYPDLDFLTIALTGEIRPRAY